MWWRLVSSKRKEVHDMDRTRSKRPQALFLSSCFGLAFRQVAVMRASWRRQYWQVAESAGLWKGYKVALRARGSVSYTTPSTALNQNVW
jgi:hypothetical protein